MQSGKHKHHYQRMVPNAITGVVGGAGINIKLGENISQNFKQSNIHMVKKVTRGSLVEIKDAGVWNNKTLVV